MANQTSIVDKAKEWCQYDPNPKTVSYVENLIQRVVDETKKQKTTEGSISSDKTALNELTSLFPTDGKRISFGTAGLRSSMTAGPLGMNDLVVIQAAQGLARYCLQENTPLLVLQQQRTQKLSAIIGYDHRENPMLGLSSLSFALYTALVFEEAGMDTILLDGFVATPIVPFAVSRTENAVVGIMITASHNPKDDAGYKVYWKDACQIRPPLDSGISQQIQQNLIPWIDYGAVLSDKQGNFGASGGCLGLSKPKATQDIISSYFDAIKTSGLVTGQSKLLLQPSNSENYWSPPSFAYTAMHGVGYSFAKRMFEAFGFPPFSLIEEQASADPSFPTVKFPNPEEKGALDIPKAIAKKKGCDLILANDPDADRLAVAEKCRKTGEWTVFTGDQIGVMLGHWIWERIGKDCGMPVTMCASTVSSQMLREIGRVEGFHFEDTLTGFKWIGSRASELNSEGKYRPLFCYEEAIGFCCGDIIFDKDGLSAMGVFAELTYSVYYKGLSLAQHMQGLYEKYGEFVSCNGYYFLNDPKLVDKIMDNMTSNGKFDNLSQVGPYEVDSFRYLGEPGYDSTMLDKKPRMATCKKSPMMTIRFTNGCIAQFRASGTEPKFKYYIELKGKPGISREIVTKDLEEMSGIILEKLLQPDQNGLKRQ